MQQKPVTITVDTAKTLGPLKRIWRSIGYDELNWTYTQTGKKIFEEIAALNDGPYWIRNHNIFSSGNLRSSPYVASTNCYSEDAEGNPVYDWTIVDRIYDVYVKAGCKPMTELDFMPCALSSNRDPYKPYESGRFVPGDYDKWRELNRQFALHLIGRYGLEEVRTWYFTSWNEPDGRSWIDIPSEPGRSVEEHEAARCKEFLKVHDYAIDGILAADDQLRVGGPDVACSHQFLDMFLEHCGKGTNHATGKTGSRLDFVSFHTKGTGKVDGVLNNPDFDLLARRDMLRFLEVMKKYPKFRGLPVLCNEWDIDVWSPGGVYDHPNFRYRNTSYFPVFLIRCVKEILDLMDKEKIDLELITQWTFYFHGMRCFEGTRSLFDPLGIRKPVFNGLEMLARIGRERLAAATDDTMQDIAPGQAAGMHGARRPRGKEEAEELGGRKSIQPYPCVDALAALDKDSFQVLVWNQMCGQYAEGVRDVCVRMEGLKDIQQLRVTEYRIDEHHSNAHTVWEQLGCPDWPDDEQIAAMRSREKLEAVFEDHPVAASGGVAEVKLSLPVHSVSLLVFELNGG